MSYAVNDQELRCIAAICDLLDDFDNEVGGMSQAYRTAARKRITAYVDARAQEWGDDDDMDRSL